MPRNPALILLALTFVVLGVLAIAGVRLPIGQDEAIRREVRLHAASQDVNARIDTALKAGDTAKARSYFDLATYMGWRATPTPSPATTDHATNMNADAAMSQKLGSKSQAVAELTGKYSLAAFGTSLSVWDFVVEHIVGFGAWLLALFGLAIGRRVVPLLRT